MDASRFGLAVAATVFASGCFGLALQRLLPERLTTGPARDMIGAVVGLLSLLSALTLGLLIWTAYGVYSGQNLAIQSMAARVLAFDLALADYGADADPGRALLRQDLAKTIAEVWGREQSDKEFAADTFSAAIANLRRREAYLDSLTPTTDRQRTALAAANATVDGIAQSRLQMAFALASPVSYPLVLTVVGWATGLFLGFGLMSRASAMAVAALGCGAIAVASVGFLIVDLSAPYSGIFRASSAPLEQVLRYMGQEQGQGRVGGSR